MQSSRERLALLDRLIGEGVSAGVGHCQAVGDGTDGRVVRIPIPPLNEERRKELVKHLHRILENHRTGVRNARREVKEAIEHLEKDKKVSEDDRTRSLEELEKITHQETKKMEDLSATKEKEILDIR